MRTAIVSQKLRRPRNVCPGYLYYTLNLATSWPRHYPLKVAIKHTSGLLYSQVNSSWQLRNKHVLMRSFQHFGASGRSKLNIRELSSRKIKDYRILES